MKTFQCLYTISETVRIKFFVDLLVDARHPVMLVGAAGSGKTVLINEKLGQLGDGYMVTNVPFNFYYSSEMLQKVLEKPLEKKKSKNYGHSLTSTVCMMLNSSHSGKLGIPFYYICGKIFSYHSFDCSIMINRVKCSLDIYKESKCILTSHD